MRKIFLFAAFLLLSSCSDSKKIDLYGELQERPGVGLTLEDGTAIPGFEGNFCTAVVCMQDADPDFSALTHTPIVNGEPLTFTVGNTTDEVESFQVELIKQNGDRFNRDHPVAQIEPYVFTVEKPFNSKETFVIVYVRLDMVNVGRSNFYFPVELQ